MVHLVCIQTRVGNCNLRFRRNRVSACQEETLKAVSGAPGKEALLGTAQAGEGVGKAVVAYRFN
jgi:hypothetical protein